MSALPVPRWGFGPCLYAWRRLHIDLVALGLADASRAHAGNREYGGEDEGLESLGLTVHLDKFAPGGREDGPKPLVLEVRLRGKSGRL